MEFIDPDKERFKLLKNLPLDHQVDMLNLVCLNRIAQYADGTEVSGKEAYRAYGEASGPIFKGVGGIIIWSGVPQFMVIGPANEHWDIAFIAGYPTGQAFLDMVYDPAYQAVVHHRQAAVKTSRLVRMRPQSIPGVFG